MEVKSELKVFKVEQACDETVNGIKCGGSMTQPKNSVGMAFMSNPPQYPHLCDKCGFRKNFLKTYPAIEYGTP